MNKKGLMYMRYFIDFEATQYSDRIISVGCVREDGAAFHSLVNPDRKLTDFIISLTGITQEMVDAAPSADEVFSDLFNFVKEDDTTPEFYCYGNSDKEFCKATYEKMATTFKAKCMLGYLRTGLIDFGDIAKAHFGLNTQISLLKVYNYYKQEECTQTHDALEDAKMLMYVCQKIEENENEFDAFPEYRVHKAVTTIKKEAKSTEDLKSTDAVFFRLKKGKVAETYYTLEEAITWILEHKMPAAQRAEADPVNIGRKIKSAALNHKEYFKTSWAMSTVR